VSSIDLQKIHAEHDELDKDYEGEKFPITKDFMSRVYCVEELSLGQVLIRPNPLRSKHSPHAFILLMKTLDGEMHVGYLHAFRSKKGRFYLRGTALDYDRFQQKKNIKRRKPRLP
jgi:hypothetical protein